MRAALPPVGRRKRQRRGSSKSQLLFWLYMALSTCPAATGLVRPFAVLGPTRGALSAPSMTQASFDSDWKLISKNQKKKRLARATEAPPPVQSISVDEARGLEGQIIRAARTRGRWSEAIDLFQRMQAGGYQPSRAAYAAALRASAKGARWELAMELLAKYEHLYDLDPEAIAAALTACCRAGRAEEGKQLLSKGVDSAIGDLPLTCWRSVMQTCHTVGDTNGVLEVAELLLREGKALDESTYELVVTSHISRQDWVSATRTLVDMSAEGYTPTGRDSRKWRLVSAVDEELGEAPEQTVGGEGEDIRD